MEFKEGDWVITEFTIEKTRGIKKIITLAKDGWNTFQNEDGSIEAAPYEIIELWQPKVGEYVIPIIDHTLSMGFEVCIWDKDDSYKCEPFIGSPPSFITTKEIGA